MMIGIVGSLLAAACFGMAAGCATIALRPAMAGAARRVTAKAIEERSRGGGRSRCSSVDVPHDDVE